MIYARTISIFYAVCSVIKTRTRYREIIGNQLYISKGFSHPKPTEKQKMRRLNIKIGLNDIENFQNNE